MHELKNRNLRGEFHASIRPVTITHFAERYIDPQIIADKRYFSLMWKLVSTLGIIPIVFFFLNEPFESLYSFFMLCSVYAVTFSEVCMLSDRF